MALRNKLRKNNSVRILVQCKMLFRQIGTAWQPGVTNWPVESQGLLLQTYSETEGDLVWLVRDEQNSWSFSDKFLLYSTKTSEVEAHWVLLLLLKICSKDYCLCLEKEPGTKPAKWFTKNRRFFILCFQISFLLNPHNLLWSSKLTCILC